MGEGHHFSPAGSQILRLAVPVSEIEVIRQQFL